MQPVLEFEHDGFDRRLSARTFDGGGAFLASADYTYDGSRVVQEDRTDFVGPPSTFELTWAVGLARYEDPLAGIAYFPIVDGSGSLRSTTDATGAAGVYTGLFDRFGSAVLDQGARPPFAAGADCGTFSDSTALLAFLDGTYDSLLDVEMTWHFESAIVDPFPMPAPTGVQYDLHGAEPETFPLPQFEIPMGPVSFTPDDLLDLYDTFSSINDPVTHGTNGAAFLADVVIEGPQTASDRALAGDFGGVIQGASTLGHLAAGETDKILQAAEQNPLGKLGIALGEGAVALWWWATGCD